MEISRTIDVTGCHYGLHKRTGQYLAETGYYSFLAGFVRSLKLQSILEIGTHYGGSSMAMSRGACSDGGGLKIVTIDKTNLNPEGFRDYPHIRRIHGDSLRAEVVKKTLALLPAPIDLIYLDSKHEYEHAKANLETYAEPLQPAFVLLDDVHHNLSMEKIWAELVAAHPCFDASELARRPCGFGVVAYREPLRAP